MTGFDIAILLLIGAGAVTGFLRGFLQEVIALAAWFVGLFCIHFLHTPLYQFLKPHIGTASGSSVLAFAILLLVPYGAVKVIARWAGETSRASVLGPIDRVLGFGFGGIKGFIIAVMGFSVLVLGYDLAWGAGGRPIWITQARTYPIINRASEELVQLIADRRKGAAQSQSNPAGKK
jgi:membrane protein required for colicin V production